MGRRGALLPGPGGAAVKDDDLWMTRVGCALVLLSTALTLAAVAGIAWWVTA